MRKCLVFLFLMTAIRSFSLKVRNRDIYGVTSSYQSLSAQSEVRNGDIEDLEPGSSLFKPSPVPGYSKKIDEDYQRKKLAKILLDKDLITRTIADWSRPMPAEYVDAPLILCGPSGVGKGRLIKALMKDYSKFFKKVVTHTTRAPRIDTVNGSEVNGTDYHFVTKEFYDAMLADGLFLENAKVHNNYYGISCESLKSVTNEQKIPIIEVDIQGAKSIKKFVASTQSLRPKYVFVSPQSINMLRERLDIRATETEEDIQLRIKNAVLELEESKEEGLFDEELVNDDFEKTVNTFFRLARDWYPQLPSPARIRMLQRKIAKVREMEQSMKTNKEVGSN